MAFHRKQILPLSFIKHINGKKKQKRSRTEEWFKGKKQETYNNSLFQAIFFCHKFYRPRSTQVYMPTPSSLASPSAYRVCPLLIIYMI